MATGRRHCVDDLPTIHIDDLIAEFDCDQARGDVAVNGDQPECCIVSEEFEETRKGGFGIGREVISRSRVAHENTKRLGRFALGGTIDDDDTLPFRTPELAAFGRIHLLDHRLVVAQRDNRRSIGRKSFLGCDKRARIGDLGKRERAGGFDIQLNHSTLTTGIVNGGEQLGQDGLSISRDVGTSWFGSCVDRAASLEQYLGHAHSGLT